MSVVGKIGKIEHCARSVNVGGRVVFASRNVFLRSVMSQDEKSPFVDLFVVFFGLGPRL